MCVVQNLPEAAPPPLGLGKTKLILDDKRVALRLSGQPEFLLRLDHLLWVYGTSDRAGLVVQARPAQGANFAGVNVHDQALQQRFLAGAGDHATWWNGFRSMTAAMRTFHGVASLSSRDQPSWVFEVHRDGHFIAGLWKFPELPGSNGTSVPVIADFHAGVFDDFFTIVAATVQLSSGPVPFEVTATLVHADQLHFASKSDWGGQHRISSAPLSVENLQWPVIPCELGTSAWTACAKTMGEALTGAYHVMS
jgi:hypothetical protein